MAQLAHAAGLSARLAPELPEHTRVVVLALADLEPLLRDLEAQGLPVIGFRETEGPHRGLTALGLAPAPGRQKLLSHLPLWGRQEPS